MNHPNFQYGSVYSDIEAVSLAGQPLDCHPAWFSEIEPFPNAVLAHHYPDVPNLGDMTGIADQVFAGTVTSPDILVGATYCQAFSVADARKGLADPRGAITLKYKEFANIVDETRQQLHQPSVTVRFGGGNRQGPIDTAACLTARGHKCDFEVETFAAQSVTGQWTHALNTANGGKGSSEDGTGRGVPIVTYKATLPGMPVAFSQTAATRFALRAVTGKSRARCRLVVVTGSLRTLILG
uniref:DNA cytosine methyltransferase n=1 Tax=Enterobacter mori TaxID=539813 RepID=UPI000237CEA1